MFSLSLKRVPENGAVSERALHLSREELGLSEFFHPSGVELSYELRRIFDKVFGSVEASSGVHLTCARCTTGFDRGLKTSFKVQFEPRSDAKMEDDEEDSTSTLIFYDGDVLPLGEEIRQELELLVPFSPLCKQDCKGLCPRCGQNWNEADCACPKTTEGTAFSVLDQLKTKQDP